MDARPLTPDLRDRWEVIARDSDDAWFWQTTRWMDWVIERAGEDVVADRSFFVAQGSELVALCPLIVEQGADGRRYAFCGGPVPSPVIKAGIGRAGRQEIMEFYARNAAMIAAEHDVRYASVKVPSLCPAYLQAGRAFANPLLRLGYFDLPYLTQIVDLRVAEPELWSRVRKGHKADIKAAGRRLGARVWDRTTLPPGKFAEYQALHAKDAGRVTRTQRTFDLMEAWVHDGMAALVEADEGGRAVAFALLMIYKNGAYYGSGCKDPDLGPVAASHLVQWTAITWLKAHGIDWYDVGLQQFGPQWFDLPSDKDVSISAFKRGFGGDTMPLVTAECFYSSELLEETFARRVRGYLAASGRLAETR